MTTDAPGYNYNISTCILSVRKASLFVHRLKITGVKKYDAADAKINIIFFPQLLEHFS